MKNQSAPSAVTRAEPDGYAVLFMPGTEHFCFVGIWTTRESAELIHGKTRGGTSTIAPMYFAPPSATKRDADDFFYGVLAAMDLLLLHDQPVIAREILTAVGPADVMRVAKADEYAFLPQLKKLYRSEGIE